MNGGDGKREGTFRCPECGAEVYDGARFCLHCMTRFDEKTEIAKPKPRPSRKRAIIAALIAAAVIAAAVLLTVAAMNDGKTPEAGTPDDASAGEETGEPERSELIRDYTLEYDPICTYDDFIQRVGIVSESSGLGGLWDPSAFKSVSHSDDGMLVRYNAPVNIPDAVLSAAFYDGGKYIVLMIHDATPEYEADADALLACMANAVYNRYTDVIDILSDGKVYPRSALDEPFFEPFTDIVRRTDAYKKDIENGAEITTEYITFGTGTDDLFSQFYRTERKTADATLYDLYILIDYAPAYSNG